MVQVIGGLHVVAEVRQDGKSILVDCAIREKDITEDVILFLLSKARGDEEADIEEALKTIQADAIGG